MRFNHWGDLQVAGTAVGAHGNAWSGVLVLANGRSEIVDLQSAAIVSIFGSCDVNSSLAIQISQDRLNFFDVAFLAVGLTGGDFGGTIDCGARYMRLKSSAQATITATIAGK